MSLTRGYSYIWAIKVCAALNLEYQSNMFVFIRTVLEIGYRFWPF